MDEFFEKLHEWRVLEFAIKVLAAIVIFIVGRWIAKMVRNVVKKMLTNRKADEAIVSFVSNLVYILLMVFICIAVLAKVGIQTGSFIAVIGAAGLAIGLALQGSLANFAAGFLLILFKPIKVGDYIEGAGTSGFVEAIHVFTTQLKTPDNKVVIIPNAKLTGDNITNFSAKDTRRVDFVFGVSYSDDLQKVKQVLQSIISADDRILKDPESMIAVKELADSSVNFVARAWVKPENYWGVFFDTTETVKKRFDTEGIGIPFPQRDVHLYEHK